MRQKHIFAFTPIFRSEPEPKPPKRGDSATLLETSKRFNLKKRAEPDPGISFRFGKFWFRLRTVDFQNAIYVQNLDVSTGTHTNSETTNAGQHEKTHKNWVNYIKFQLIL